MESSNYGLVVKVIEVIAKEGMMEAFKVKFEEGKNVSKDEFMEFMEEWYNEGDDYIWNELNWKFVESGGDYDVFKDMV